MDTKKKELLRNCFAIGILFAAMIAYDHWTARHVYVPEFVNTVIVLITLALAVVFIIAGIISIIIGIKEARSFWRRRRFKRVIGFAPAKNYETREALYPHVKKVLLKLAWKIDDLILREEDLSASIGKDLIDRKSTPENILADGKSLVKIREQIKKARDKFYKARDVARNSGGYADKIKKDSSFKEFLS